MFPIVLTDRRPRFVDYVKLCLLVLAAVLAVGVLISVMFPGVAHAQAAGDATEVVPNPGVVDWSWIVATGLGGLVVPFLTAIVAKADSKSWVKSLVAMTASALLAVANAIITNGGVFVIRDMVVLFVLTWFPAVLAYWGLWANVGKNGVGINAIVLPSTGIGSPPSP